MLYLLALCQSLWQYNGNIKACLSVQQITVKILYDVDTNKMKTSTNAKRRIKCSHTYIWNFAIEINLPMPWTPGHTECLLAFAFLKSSRLSYLQSKENLNLYKGILNISNYCVLVSFEYLKGLSNIAIAFQIAVWWWIPTMTQNCQHISFSIQLIKDL